MEVYFDNAATTPIDEEVLETMLPYLKSIHGNPSSTHSHGREARVAIEESRKKIASILGAHTGEIFFTSGGTESDNIAIQSVCRNERIQHIISSKMEHHAVLNTVEQVAKTNNLKVHYVNNDEQGLLDYHHLGQLLDGKEKCLVSLMHANNEIGNVNDIERISGLCKSNGAIFHSDTVQTLGTKSFNLTESGPDLIAGSAHKFYGPKGIGLLYARKGIMTGPLQFGGNQEKGLRPGTENTASIIGMAKALEITQSNLELSNAHYSNLKNHLVNALSDKISNIKVNGANRITDQPNVVNILFPDSKVSSLVTFTLDLEKISVSGGSACGSGAIKGSHVLAELNAKETRPSVRFSFGKQNTIEEVNYAVDKIAAIFNK